MGIKLTNNAFATLAAGINSSATSITLTSGQGARFPTLTASDYFYATLIDTSNNLEIVKCTARSTDVLTVVRAQESTTARAYSAGDRIEIRLTAATFVDSLNPVAALGYTPVNKAGDTMTGTLTLTYDGVTRFSLPIGATDPNFTVNGDTNGTERRDIALRWQSNNSHGYVSVLRSDMGGTTFLNGYGSIRFNIGSSNGSLVAGMTSSGFAVGLTGLDNTSYTGSMVATTNAQFHGRIRAPGFNVGGYTTSTWSDLGTSGDTDGMFTRADGQCYVSVDDLFRIRDNTSSSTENKRFEFNTDTGSAGADANWNSNAFDFAEMFEWADGNPDNEDRIGYSVALVPDTGKVKIAEAGDTPIGIVSGTAGFIGDSGFNCWSQMYMSDEWGRPLWDYLYNEDGTPQLNKYGEHARTKRINPDYDPNAEYVQRRNRPEWATVGLLGKVFMRVGRPVNPNWIRLKPVGESIELWLVR